MAVWVCVAACSVSSGQSTNGFTHASGLSDQGEGYEAVTNRASYSVSDINVAENALRDGLHPLAREHAVSAMYSTNSAQVCRNRAFTVIMAAYEQELPPEEWGKGR